jgi:plastocyanin
MSFQAAGQATSHSASKLSTLTLVVGLLALAGCGGSSSSTTSSASTPASAVATSTTSTPATVSTPAPSPAASKPKAPPAPARRSPPATASTPAPPSSTPSAGQALSLEANPEGQLKYNKTSLTAKAGKVSIAFTNKALLGHNLTVASPSTAVVGATRTFRGGSKILTLNLKRGSYQFYCSVPGHRIAGMEGALTVN